MGRGVGESGEGEKRAKAGWRIGQGRRKRRRRRERAWAHQLAIRSSQHVARVWVGVEEASFEKLRTSSKVGYRDELVNAGEGVRVGHRR